MDQKRLVAIRDLVRKTYSDAEIVARYAHIGLWPAEEILVLEYFPDDAVVLDIGCGAGRTTIPLAEMGLQVVGIDFSPAMIRLAGELAGVSQVTPELRVMDVMDLGFADASFDIAFFSYNGFELLPGIAGKKLALREVFRVLKPGGLFVFCTHSPFALNQFAFLRLKTLLKFCTGRLLGLPVREQELGERFSEDADEEVKYLQVLPPLLIQRMLRDGQFELVYYNARSRIEKGRKWGWPAIFADGERFYVARKTAV
jgi:ubiquinone/menaquinone biosynthesis C-methylase UbiE